MLSANSLAPCSFLPFATTGMLFTSSFYSVARAICCCCPFTLQLFTCNIYTQQHKSELSGRKLFLFALQLSQTTDSIKNFLLFFYDTSSSFLLFFILFSWFGHTNDINIFHFSTSYQFKHVKDTFSSFHFVLLLIFSQTHYTARSND